MGAALTFLLLVLNFPPTDIAVVAAFLVGCAILWWIPPLQSFPTAPKLVLIFFALRPILDAALSKDVHRSTLPLQNIFAVSTAIVLLFFGRRLVPRLVKEFPSNVLIALLALTGLAWLVGGLGAGVYGFLRTSWGLLVALLLGALLQTERQIEIFIRTLFYSSFFVLAILAFNLKEGEYIGNVWRVTGQFGVATTLAEVCFSLFLLGLYTIKHVQTSSEKLITICLLLFLVLAIVLTQSRTIGGLLVLCIFLWLWVEGHRRAVYGLALCLALAIAGVVLSSSLSSQSRIASSVSFQQKELSEDVINLTGRTFLWAKTLEQFASANAVHKIIGLGWGTVFANFETFGYELSSVTENSFLWFLVGSGILGLLAFSTYLACAISRSWRAWHRADSEFERRLSLLAFLVGLAFLIEGFTTDLVLSPVASSYLYAILSIFMFRSQKRFALKVVR
ncbi:MAG TPA: O-antigen ligase family protein [Terriglobales bacterium]|nr:O-antigen ligase family protein [Terriglobales bacterium]